jgi:hypothetical protein
MTAAAPGVAGLTRANLRARTLATLRRGGWHGPDVLLVEADGARVVVKDFAARSRLVRSTLGPWLVRREARTLRVLADHPAVPRVLGRLDRLALVCELRGGTRLSGRRPWTFSPAFGEALAGAVAGLHARGVVHADLSHRGNVLADPSGRPVLLDFETALYFRPGGLAARWLLPLAARVDRRAVRKWRRRMAARPKGERAPARSHGSG